MNYWEERYQKGETGWDAGQITTPIKEYIDQLTNKNLKIESHNHLGPVLSFSERRNQ